MQFAPKTVLNDGRPVGCIEVAGACHPLASLGPLLATTALPDTVAGVLADWSEPRTGNRTGGNQ